MQTEKNTFAAVAQELADSFIVGKRSDGAEFYKMSPRAPSWMKPIPRAAHEAVDGPDPRLPSDWIYSLAARAAEFVAEHDSPEDARDAVAEFADGAVDIPTADLFAWAAESGYNRALCEEAVAEWGQPADGFDSSTVERFLRMGQFLAAERVAFAIIDAVAEEVSARGGE